MKISPQSWWQPALVIFARVTGWIAGPVILALFIGKALDRKLDTDPWIFLSLTVFAFIVSSVGIVREAAKWMKEINEQTKKDNGDRPTDTTP